jgi:hypothetical protein
MAARGGGPTPPELRNMVPRGGSDPPPQNYGTWCPRGVRPTPPESRNGGTVTYHPWQRNETLRGRNLNFRFAAETAESASSVT